MKLEGMAHDSLPTEARSTLPPLVHLLDLLAVLARRRRFILWTTASVAVATAVVVFLLPSKYTATTVVLPPVQNSTLNTNLLAQYAGTANLTTVSGMSFEFLHVECGKCQNPVAPSSCDFGASLLIECAHRHTPPAR